MAQGFKKFMGKGDSGAKKKERIRQEKKKIRQETKEYFEKKKQEARKPVHRDRLVVISRKGGRKEYWRPERLSGGYGRRLSKRQPKSRRLQSRKLKALKAKVQSAKRRKQCRKSIRPWQGSGRTKQASEPASCKLFKGPKSKTQSNTEKASSALR